MKDKHFDINEEGVSIRFRFMTSSHNRTFERVIIITHGFGGNKEAANITRFSDKELGKHKNDALIAFDWPAHGKDGRKKLEISECLQYLSIVIKYAKDTLQAEYIYNYSVSMGGYLTLLYIHENGNPFTKVALRAPGLRMYESMLRNLSEADREKLAKGREVEVGFERKMKISQSLLDELQAKDVRTYEYIDWAENMLLIHGTKDEMVDINDSRKFSEDNIIDLVEVEGADHTFRNPKYMDQAIHAIVEFFAPEN